MSSTDDALLNTIEAANILGVSPQWLEARRDNEARSTEGPTYVRLGALYKYRRSDLYSYIEENTVKSA
jgi:hypothetical protein